jgi:hypothetical protein
MNTRSITQDARNVAQRDLKMAALSLLELRALIEKHRNNPTFSSQVMTFASQVIASAARQMLVANRTMGER